MSKRTPLARGLLLTCGAEASTMQLSVHQLFEIGLVFDPRPDPALYFPTLASELVRQRLNDALQANTDLPVLTGSSGSGKTLLLGVVLRQQARRWTHVAQLRFPSMDGEDLLRAIAYALGLKPAQRPEDVIAAELAARRSRDENTLLVVDEAHRLSPAALALLHRLSRPGAGDVPLLRVILVGSAELIGHLRNPVLNGIAAAFQPRLEMIAFGPRESLAFIKDRLHQCQGETLPSFTSAAVKELHNCTQGVPGRLQLLCRELLHESLLAEDDEPIEREQVVAQALQLGFAAAPAVAQPAAVAGGASPAQQTPPRPMPALPWVASRRRQRMLAASLAVVGLCAAVLLRSQFGAGSIDPDATHLSAQAAPTTPATQRVATAPMPEAAAVSLASAPSRRTRPTPPARAQHIEPDTTLAEASLRPSRTTAAARSHITASTRLAAADAPRECSVVLTQLSLGEPLTPKQQHLMEAVCL